VVPAYVMKVCAGNGGITPFTLNQDIGLRLVASFTPRPINPLERVLGTRWRGWMGHSGKGGKKTILPPPRIEPRSLGVTITTTTNFFKHNRQVPCSFAPLLYVIRTTAWEVNFHQLATQVSNYKYIYWIILVAARGPTPRTLARDQGRFGRTCFLLLQSFAAGSSDMSVEMEGVFWDVTQWSLVGITDFRRRLLPWS